MAEQRRRVDLLPWLILGAVALAALLAWWLFPVLQGLIARQDCVATGRTNCG